MKEYKSESVAEATRALLTKKPFLKELMSMDAVNYRGLARYFKPAVEERTGRDDVSLDAIVVAIRRYEQDAAVTDDLMDRIESVLAESELMMKSDVVYYTFPRRREFQDIAAEAYTEIDQRSGDRIYILQSDAEIGIVTDAKNAAVVEERSQADAAKNIERSLAMVVVDSPEEILAADGILSYLTEHIIMNGVGLVDMFSTYTETVFLTREEDSMALYETLRDLTAATA